VSVVLIIPLVVVVLVVLVLTGASVRLVQQYERGVVLRSAASCPTSVSRACVS
jgi:regulator of protease activity HflC (stomatin/prohibitin superfamily)